MNENRTRAEMIGALLLIALIAVIVLALGASVLELASSSFEGLEQ